MINMLDIELKCIFLQKKISLYPRLKQKIFKIQFNGNLKAKKNLVYNTCKRLKPKSIFLTNEHTLILFFKQWFISNTKYEKSSWPVAYKTE